MLPLPGKNLTASEGMVYIFQIMHLLLSPLYLLYRTGSRVKNYLYRIGLFRAVQAPIPTISVGNITFGGSNKTPLAKHLLAFLKTQGYKPSLISRGYRGKWEKKGGVLSDGKTIHGGWRESGDEPFMVAKGIAGIGIFIGKNRLLSCLKAKDLGFDVAVLDDGFQHRRLKRNLDIVLWNPKETKALREPIASIARAQLLLVEGGLESGLPKGLQTTVPDSKVFAYNVESLGLYDTGGQRQDFQTDPVGRRILAVCGIAHPERFFRLLEEQGLKPCAVMAFPDHFPYPPSSVKRIQAAFKANQAEWIITTEKDIVKFGQIEDLMTIPVYFLKIDLAIEPGFYENILSSLRKAKT